MKEVKGRAETFDRKLQSLANRSCIDNLRGRLDLLRAPRFKHDRCTIHAADIPNSQGLSFPRARRVGSMPVAYCCHRTKASRPWPVASVVDTLHVSILESVVCRRKPDDLRAETVHVSGDDCPRHAFIIRLASLSELDEEFFLQIFRLQGEWPRLDVKAKASP